MWNSVCIGKENGELIHSVISYIILRTNVHVQLAVLGHLAVSPVPEPASEL